MKSYYKEELNYGVKVFHILILGDYNFLWHVQEVGKVIIHKQLLVNYLFQEIVQIWCLKYHKEKSTLMTAWMDLIKILKMSQLTCKKAECYTFSFFIYT